MNMRDISLCRRQLIGATLLATAWPVLARPAATLIEVWKDPQCGCCHDWIAHLEAAGFTVRSFEEGNDVARRRLGMPEAYASCHTARVGGYVIEGHVPATDIRRLLAEKPQALGLAVPGMPVGSPGMDGPAYGGRRDRYNVLLIGRNGGAAIFKRYS
jgi:hypothetical protein